VSILDNIKAVISIANNLGNVDLAREVRTLESELGELLDDNRRLKDENASLAARLAEREELIWDDELNAYMRVPPGGARTGPFCPACRDGHDRTVRMAHEGQGYRCTVCGHYSAIALP
jgi:regulator of replication initiation timing